MQFSSITILSFLAVLSSAAPAPAPAPAGAIADTQASAANSVATLKASGCNVLKCISALAGETAACGAAAAELGANPLADIACFASVTGNIAGDVCDGCL